MKNIFTVRNSIVVAIVAAAFSILAYIYSAPVEEVKPEATPIAEQVYEVAKTNSLIQERSQESIENSEVYKNLNIAPIEIIPSSEIISMLESGGSIKDAAINPARNVLVIADETKPTEPIIYASYFVEEQRLKIVELLESSDITLNVVAISPVVNNPGYNYATGTPATGTISPSQPATPFSVLGLIVNLLLIGMIFFFIARFIRRRWFSNFAKRNKNLNEAADTPTTRFADVAGCDEAIEDMKELVEFLRDPKKFEITGAKAPRGALLVGPPGTGKTLLARAVAGEAGVPFYSAAGSDFVEMYVGVGAKRIRDLFAKAKKHEEGAIIFIDEIDAVGRARSSRAETSNNTEGENTLNALLVEMDGFEASKVIVLGATNREDMLDKALTRPGRLDRKIQVPLPDRVGRFKILNVHAAGKPFSEDVDWDLVARRTPGMSGAELASVVNEACLVAARESRQTVTNKDLDSAIATTAMGKPRHSAIVSEHDRLVTAWHEAGHTVAAMVLPEADDPVSVSIIPRGPAGGVTWMSQGDDIFLTRKRAFARLVVAMGGRAAEEILLDGEFTSGPHGDLTAATQTALAMVTQYGMTDMGLMVRSEGFLSTGAKLTDDTVIMVEKLLSDALEVARDTLSSHKSLLKQIVDELLENDTLTQEDLLLIKEGKEMKPPVLPAPPSNYSKGLSDSAPRIKNRKRKKTFAAALLASVEEGFKVFKDIKPGRRRKI